MTERERFINTIKKSLGGWLPLHMAGKVAERVTETLIQDGAVFPACRVGDKVYRISSRTPRTMYIEETTISRIAVDNEGIWVFCACNPISKRVFGKTVFLTREEAEQALKGGAE